MAGCGGWDTGTKVDLVTGNLVDDLIIDRAAIVGARVVVEILLDIPTKLEQVITLYPSYVVAEHLVLAVPDPLTCALVIDVIRNQGRSAFRG